MDEFTPSQITTPPFEQSPLMNNRDPNSSARMWSRLSPLHSLSRQTRSSQGQGRARLARLDKIPPTISRDMFPFRVYKQPTVYQGSPTWTDAYGAANYRTFGVWTGNAISFMPLGGSWAEGWILSPETVQVARTGGYNFVEPVINESYNEAYSQISSGLYGAFSPLYSELYFTAPPNSYAAFWMTWDANVFVDGITMPIWPTLHFGGISQDGSYFGDANPVNFNTSSPAIEGGIPYAPDLIALAQASYSPTSFPAILIAMIQVGAQGADADTGNDGLTYIIQCQHDHIQKGFTPSYRGDYAATTLYFPGDVMHMLDDNGFDLVSQNSTQYAISGIPPTLYPYPSFGANAIGSPEGFTDSPWSTLGTPYYDASMFEPDNEDVSIAQAPLNTSAALGAAAQLSVQIDIAANASNGFSVQWYIKFPGQPDESAAEIVDATVYAGSGTCSPNYAFFDSLGTQTALLTISNATGMGGFTFYAVISEGTTSIAPPYPLGYTTMPVILTTYPMCVQAPQNTIVNPGDPALFWVVGDPEEGTLTYQWQRNGSNVTDGTIYQGVTTPQLAILSTATLSNGDQFRCLLINLTDSAIAPSPSATLGIT